MDKVITTPRLRLISVETAEMGSQELEWLHTVRSDEQATFWSIFGTSKTLEDTQRITKGALPGPDQGVSDHRFTYAIHRPLDSNSPSTSKTEVIGLMSLLSPSPQALVLPPALTFPADQASQTLALELGYCFLPQAWGQGYATECAKAVLEACAHAWELWSPYKQLYVRAITAPENAASRNVLRKAGLEERGVHVWEAEEGSKGVFVAGRWRTRDELIVFGKMFVRKGE